MTIFHLRLQHNHSLVNCGRTEGRGLALLCDNLKLNSDWEKVINTTNVLIVVFPCMLIITQLLFQQNALVY
jgi:hypothetical protein